MSVATFMAVAGMKGGDWIAYGVPPVFLLLAIGRGFRTASRGGRAVYVVALTGWMTHATIHFRAKAYEAENMFARAQVEPPDSSSFPIIHTGLAAEQDVVELQSPGELGWKLDGRERLLQFDYGFVPKAYEVGTTNGAGFTLSLREGEVVRPVFHRALDPRARPGDRGTQHARVFLPPFAAGAKLTMAIDSGEFGDAAWDWLYLGNLHFSRSVHFLPSQFPFYRRLPDSVHAPLAQLFQTEGRTSFLQLHAPAELGFRLQGAEKQLRFFFGLLPGAYQHGNTTDGARFVAWLQPGRGAPRLLWDRLLEPLTRPGDRGPQPAVVSLGDFAAGDQLVLKIEPGPVGSNAFDWTYISRLALE